MSNTMNPEMNRSAFGLLEETDNALMELGDTVGLLATAMQEACGSRTMENVMLHIASNIQDIRAKLDEATAAVMRERKDGRKE